MTRSPHDDGPSAERAVLRTVVEGLLSGDAERFRTIRYRIIQYLKRCGHHRGLDAEEMADEVLLILFEDLRRRRFRGENIRALNAYLYAIVRNHCSKARRKNRLHYTDTPPDVASPHSESPEHTTERNELLDKVLRALDGNCHELLSLKFGKGWTDQEIADHFGKSKNAVSTAISRCLQKARNLEFMRDGE